jgi:hypothetical protein
MHENVLAPVVGGDEAVALFLAEPLDSSLGNIHEPTFPVLGPIATRKPPLNLGGASIKTKPTFYYLSIIP